jgi:nucleotide-binding universal stress UspA family protein
MYTRILVPLDGSPFAEAALPLAAALQERSGASLHLVSVFEPVPPYSDDRWMALTRDWLTQYLEDVAARERTGGRTVTTALRFGDVVDTLLRESEEMRADLIVMTTHGRGAVARAWIGSVSHALSLQSSIPMILVRPDETVVDDDPVLTTTPRTILVPLDGSELSESALEPAIEFGQLFGSAYHLTRIVLFPDVHMPTGTFTTQVNQELVEDAKASAAAYLEQHAETMRWRGLQVTTSVAVEVQPGRGVLAEAEAVGCDVIAMSTHGRSGLRRFVFGSVTDKVLRGTQGLLLLHRPVLMPAIM